MKSQPENKPENSNSSPLRMQKNTKIPSFGYKSSIFMLGMLILIWLGVPYLVQLLNLNLQWGTILIGGALSGFTIGFTQFFIETKKGMTQAFWIISVLWSLFIGLFILMFVSMGVLF